MVVGAEMAAAIAKGGGVLGELLVSDWNSARVFATTQSPMPSFQTSVSAGRLDCNIWARSAWETGPACWSLSV